jgi:multidrug transporter EmrE-like cation transporter
LYILLFLTILLRAVSDLCLKAAVHKNFKLNTPFDLIIHFFKFITNPFIWLGFFIAIFNLGLWALNLCHFSLNYAYPFNSISYILIILAGKLFFKEHLDKNKIIGIIFIIIGVSFLLLENF